MSDTILEKPVNDIDLAALGQVVDAIQADPAQARVRFHVTSRWQGQTRSETTVEAITLGGERIDRDFTITVDEPNQLLGTNAAPYPSGVTRLADGVNDRS